MAPKGQAALSEVGVTPCLLGSAPRGGGGGTPPTPAIVGVTCTSEAAKLWFGALAAVEGAQGLGSV